MLCSHIASFLRPGYSNRPVHLSCQPFSTHPSAFGRLHLQSFLLAETRPVCDLTLDCSTSSFLTDCIYSANQLWSC